MEYPENGGTDIACQRHRGSLRSLSFAIAGAIATLSAGGAAAHSIPPEAIDSQQIYWGTPASFETPATVNMEAIIKATPEHREIVRKKLEQGTARYWILLSRASDRAVRAVSEFGEKSDYDLIAETGYLGALEPPIQSDDVTDLVIETL